MAVITYEEVIPSIIPNTTMVKGLVDGVHRNYQINPVPGYVLHDKEGDWVNPETNETVLSFYIGTCSCGANYDFVANPREFYAVPANGIPEGQIFG